MRNISASLSFPTPPNDVSSRRHCKLPWIKFLSHRRFINCPLIITLNPNRTRIYVMIEDKLVSINSEEWFDFADSGKDDVAAAKA